jgi:hypothetical protein
LGLGHQSLGGLVGCVSGFLGVGHSFGLGLGNGSGFFFSGLQAGFSACRLPTSPTTGASTPASTQVRA